MKHTIKQQTHKLIYQDCKNLLDPTTGEIVQAQRSYRKENDFNFHKLWIENFYDTCSGILTGKAKLLLFLMINAQKRTNRICMSQEELALKCGISARTVSATLKELKASGFLRIRSRYILLNPEVIFKGTYEERKQAIYEWMDMEESR